jgi:hypothetical protein
MSAEIWNEGVSLDRWFPQRTNAVFAGFESQDGLVVSLVVNIP